MALSAKIAIIRFPAVLSNGKWYGTKVRVLELWREIATGGASKIRSVFYTASFWCQEMAGPLDRS